MYKILVFLTLLFMYSCFDVPFGEEEKSEDIEREEVQSDFHFILGESFTLPNGSIITFTDVLEDSRCPTDVDCVWEGNFKMLLQVNNEGKLLNSNLEPKSLEVDGLTLSISKVEPAPISTREISKNEYSVTIKYE